MSLSDSDDDNVPTVEVCDYLCKEFMQITNSNSALAHFQLQEAQWNLETALNQFYSSNNSDADAAQAAAKTSNKKPTLDIDPKSTRGIAEEAPGASAGASAGKDEPGKSDSNDGKKLFRLMTWNIDGLDENGITIRTRAVCTIVLKVKPTVVFLQEVVNDSLKILADYLSDEYWVLKGKEPGAAVPPPYFNAMLLKKSDVELDREPELIPFLDSIMGRSLLKIEVEIFGLPCILMTSHLESTKDCAAERMKQLRRCFDVLDKKIPDNVTAFFGGDLNMRDKELDQVGGIPHGVEDLWVACGSPKTCQFTWDCMRNDNLNAFEAAKFKPRSRFDRLYVKHATSGGRAWKPTEFMLAGTQRIQKYNRFPSDHWAILCSLEKI